MAPRPARKTQAMFLGIDIGTSGIKAVITGENGDVVAQGTACAGR